MTARGSFADLLAMSNAGAPASGASGIGAGVAVPGSLLVDTTNFNLYINANTKASPTWSILAMASLDATELGYLDGASTTVTASKCVVADANGTIVFDGTAERGIDFGSLTVGTTTDGVLMRAGTGIGASGLEFGTAGQRAIALYLRPTATSGTFKGMRLRSIADAASGSALSVDNFHAQASVIAGKDAAVINCGFFETIFKGTNDVDWARCLLTNVDSAASVTVSAGLVNAHIRTHTRGDETMGGVDEMLRIENEAVGGNGRQMDSFIRCMETSMSGGIKSAAYAIDCGTGTSLLGTAFLRVPDDGTICADAGTSGSGSHAGHITVICGSATKYIRLHDVS